MVWGIAWRENKRYSSRDDNGKTIKHSLDQLFYTTTDQIDFGDFLLGHRYTEKAVNFLSDTD